MSKTPLFGMPPVRGQMGFSARGLTEEITCVIWSKAVSLVPIVLTKSSVNAPGYGEMARKRQGSDAVVDKSERDR